MMTSVGISFCRNYFFDLDDSANKQPEIGMDALELAQQSEASLNNLLELEDKDDEILLQWEEKHKATNQGIDFETIAKKAQIPIYLCFCRQIRKTTKSSK